jgi:hypothetical protein
LDILFVEAFKSHGSLYVLCVRGHGEDAATILRRLLEIALQVGYLAADPSSHQDRAERYLAWFWLQVEDRVRAGLPSKEEVWWRAQYDKHKHLILDASGKRLRNWWGKGSIRDLAVALNLADTYDKDYRFVSQFAHCTSQGLLLGRRGSAVEIRTDLLVPAILVFGTRYMLSIFERWNDQFSLCDRSIIKDLVGQALDALELQPAKAGTSQAMAGHGDADIS